MAQRKDAVIRISAENHDRLREIMVNLRSTMGKTLTKNQMMEMMLDSMEKIQHSEMVYIVRNVAYREISDARGQAILEAVKKKEIPEWPEIAIIVGYDDGGKSDEKRD